jgi:hypothetical protein
MKKSIFVICFLSVFLLGCADKKKEAYTAGCKAGIYEVLGQLGMQPAEEPVKAFCDKAADAAK